MIYFQPARFGTQDEAVPALDAVYSLTDSADEDKSSISIVFTIVMQELQAVLKRANSGFERAWESILRLSNKDALPEMISVASRRLGSYNPENRAISEENPELSDAMDVLCNLIKEKAEHIQENEADIGAWKTIFHAYLLLNDYPNAYSAATHVSKIMKKVKDPYFSYAAGIVYSHFGYDEQAITFFDAAKAKFPNYKQFPDLHLRMAIVLRRSGNADEACQILKNLQHSPPHGLTADDINLQLAYTYQVLGKYREAGTIYEKLMRDYSHIREIVHQYVWFLTVQNDFSGYSTAKAICNRPENAEDSLLRFAAARVAMKRKDTTEAFKSYRECTANWTEEPLFWGGLGILYLRNNQEEDAVVAFQRVLYLKSDIPEVLFNMGLIYEGRDDLENARHMYHVALQHWSDNKIIQDRYTNVGSFMRKPGKQAALRELVMELDGTKYFKQPVDEISSALLETPADLSASPFVKEKDIQDYTNVLFPPFQSLFIH